jgi:hypothetical protein
MMLLLAGLIGPAKLMFVLAELVMLAALGTERVGIGEPRQPVLNLPLSAYGADVADTKTGCLHRRPSSALVAGCCLPLAGTTGS